ncbi:MAG: aminotransferase class I/II-fold pyridoxal phosphate-dependent enzyme [Planctomycetota bacterium]
MSARQADLELLASAPPGFLDATHFDTVRFPPPSWAAEHFARAALDGSQAYSGYRGHPHVLTSVAAAVGEFLGHPVDPNQNLMLTPGTQAGLFAALAARVEAKARVAVVDPDYLFTARILRFLDCDVGHVPLRATAAGFSPDLAVLEREFRDEGARDFVFSHPNNPTGSVYPPEVVGAMRSLAEQYDVRVVADELYSRLLFGEAPFTHFATDPAAFQRTVTLLGPSKTESLSGYRLGVVVGPGATMKAAEDVLSVTALRAPAYAQNVLLPWLRSDAAWLHDRLKEFDVLRQMTRQAFAKLPWARAVVQEATAYAWVDVTALGLSDTVISKALMSEARVLVSPGYQFGPSGKGHFRLCYARDEAEWEAVLGRITATLARLAAAAGVG